MGTPPGRPEITGLVLAGGRGERMGGADKGLQPWRGRPLVDHVIERLQPQVATLILSANRHIDDYARRGWPVLRDRDDTPMYAGPLAGILAGLRAARTPWLAVVPCDTPRLPADLVERLAAACTGHQGADGAAIYGQAAAAHGAGAEGRLESLCCLLSTRLADDLDASLRAGRRQVQGWLARHAIAPVYCSQADDAAAFANFNRPEDLSA